MTFDAKTLLTAPLPPDLTVDRLAVAIKHLQELGLGGATIKLPDGAPLGGVELVAQGAEPAHIVFKQTTGARECEHDFQRRDMSMPRPDGTQSLYYACKHCGLRREQVIEA
ncbi:hypothetical protein [Duganella callida]|uniref:Uncharacterized protein n=1 Tax=Duganella callida TaxID=2561932 RepID=A0A4Y9S3N1_9BURK|nr:hypothetical protein [Duganella callida]TFW15958.1 hypothetical protein E4L98_25020 [Duganella callida]